MRISDWSSDVCSSDLFGSACGSAQSTGSAADCCPSVRIRSVNISAKRPEKLPRPGLASVSLAPSDSASIAAGPPSTQFDDRISTDRKSVVAGKSVSVRVDLGGRRLIKKKIRQYNNITTQY